MSYGNDGTAFTTIMGAIVFVFIAACVTGRGACVDASTATRALETQGYSAVRVVDRHNWFASWNGCSEHDAVSFDCAAKNPVGREVRVNVCCGWWLKDCTVRSR
jgi:hypothetical protein